MPKLRDLLSSSPEEQLADMTSRGQTAMQLARVEEELELYYHPAWKYFVAELAKIEARSLEALIVGDDPAARERIKVVRDLASLPARREDERARLTAELSAQEEEA